MSADPIQKLAANNELPERPRRGCALVLGLMALWLAMLAGVTAWGGEPIAFVLCPNREPNLAPAGVPWKNYVEAANKICPLVKAAGVRRVLLHNPLGVYSIGWAMHPKYVYGPVDANGKLLEDWRDAAYKRGIDAREMHFQQYELARMCRATFADPATLKQAGKIFSDNGVTELIIYLGGLQTVEDLEQVKRNAQPFLDMATPTMRVSFGVDTLCAEHWPQWPHVKQWASESSPITEYVKWLRSKGARVYGEPRVPAAHVSWMKNYIDGTIAEPENEVGVDLSKQPGEIIRQIAYGTPVPDNVTPLWVIPDKGAKVTTTFDMPSNWGGLP